MTSTKTTETNLYLRLSDFREGNDTFEDREAKLRAEAARRGLTVPADGVVCENNMSDDGETMKPASAFKRKRIETPSGRVELRVMRPGFRRILDDLTAGRRHVLAEDLDRTVRDPRDGEDLIDAVAKRKMSAWSISGSLNLTDGGTDSEVTMARVMVAMANKSSRDTARRVAAGRSRTAQAGHYGGGRRPFGYRPDPFAPKYEKTLIVVESEAAELRKAASAVLAGVSLRAIARDLRDRQVPTVTGAAWTPDTIRGCLLAPVISGQAAHTGPAEDDDDPRKRTDAELHTAKWTAILDRDVWQAVTDKLTDPARLTSPGNEPRWLVSGIARCHCGEAVYARSASGRPSYVCRGPQAHLRRVAPATDEHVAAHIVARLSRPDAADLLRPAPRPGCDAPALRAERERLNLRRAALVRMNVAGDLDDSDLAAGVREIKRRTAEIDQTLTAHSAPDPLAELRTGDVQAAWDALSLPRKRAVVKLLCDVTLLPGRKGAPRRFDPATVSVTPKAA